MIKVQINNICAKLTECEPLTSGMIGKLVEVSFSAEWSELNKIAVFSNGDVTKDLYESQWNGNYIPIPWEVLTTPNRAISMGIYGYTLVDGEKVLAIPTLLAEIGRTKVGTDPSDDPAADPTLPIWAQLQWEIDHFEIPDEQIAIQVQAYLDEHPIEIQPATASVLGGVKVGEGLSVTADGTLSAEGGYEPPVGGIPKTDLASDVQASLDKADSALQEHQSLAAYRTAAAQDIIDASKQDAISDLNTIRSGAAKGETAVQPTTLADYALKSDLPINVKDFGAVGDGVTDDTEAIQNALNAAEGKTLVIDGVCKITATLRVKDNTEIVGIGSKASGFDSHVAGTLFTSSNANGIYKCLFKNLKIRNRNLSPADADGHYIGQVFSSLYESRATECYVEHFAQIADRMARISSIDHCELYYINKHLVNDVIDSMIESNYINARNTAADRTIMVYGLFSNSMFSNNFCDYWGTAFRVEAGSKPSNVIGNTFDNCVSVFRDYVAGLSIVGNNYTNIKYVSANWQAGGQPSATIQATKWSVFKFDGATASHTGASTQCSLLDTIFNSNTFGNCSYYIDVENGVSVYPVQRCNFSHNAWEGLLVDAAFTNPQSSYDNGGMRTVYFDFWEGQSVDALPSANLISNAAKSVATYDGMTLWYKKREIRNFNGAWRFADGSVLSNEIWDLADRTYLSRTVAANTPRTYSTEHWYKVGYNGAEYTDAGYTDNPIVSNITKNGFTIQTKSTLTGLGFYLPHGTFTFSATLPAGIEAYLLVVPASGTLESRNQVASGATLNCSDASKAYVLLFCSRATIGTYTVSNISITDNSYAEVSTAPFYTKEEGQPKTITDTAGYFTTDTVEGALAEIGGTLDGLEDAINTIRGVS